MTCSISSTPNIEVAGSGRLAAASIPTGPSHLEPGNSIQVGVRSEFGNRVLGGRFSNRRDVTGNTGGPGHLRIRCIFFDGS